MIGFISCNPFAPALEDQLISQETLLGNRRSVDGLFEWFKNAYQLRDTTLYGQILDKDFNFMYVDFDKNLEIGWNRDVEMNTTSNFFKSVESISLEWYNYRSLDTNVAQPGAERSFNLNIIMDSRNIFRGTGSASFRLRKDSIDGYWRILTWIDKSDF